jgi:hypothetical protein
MKKKQDDAWKKLAPKSGEPKTIKRDNNPWNWCIHPLAWIRLPQGKGPKQPFGVKTVVKQ